MLVVQIHQHRDGLASIDGLRHPRGNAGAGRAETNVARPNDQLGLGPRHGGSADRHAAESQAGGGAQDDPCPISGKDAGQHVGLADEIGDEAVRRRVVQIARRACLHDPAARSSATRSAIDSASCWS